MFNTVNSLEQCGQQNIVQYCFDQLGTGCSFWLIFCCVGKNQLTSEGRSSVTTKRQYLRGVTVTISKVFETVPIVETFEASLEELDERFTRKTS